MLVAVRSPQVREGLAAMIGALDGFRVVAEAASERVSSGMATATIVLSIELMSTAAAERRKKAWPRGVSARARCTGS